MTRDARPATEHLAGHLRPRIGLVLGPALFLLCYCLPGLTGLEDAPRAVLAVTLWVATWWICEPIPMAATSLLPIVLLPLSGGASERVASAAYGNPIVFMYLGGFTIAIAIQKWNLHTRIAMAIVAMVGSGGSRLTLGIILATAFLSMWISNAATALMMLPIGLALIEEIRQQRLYDEASLQRFAKGLLLSIAYAASIGGLATLIGSVPNAVFAAVSAQSLGREVSFADWFLFAAPLTALMLVALYLYMTRVAFRVAAQQELGAGFARAQLRRLGPMAAEERTVLAVFGGVAALWIFGGFLPERWQLSDTAVSMLGAIGLFLLPARRGRLLDWADMKALPWGLLLLFGGGLSLAAAFESSGLTAWFGTLLGGLEALPFWLVIVALAAIVLLMTEIMSNTAVSNMLIPVGIGLALGIGAEPQAIMATIALSASCAFMLPISTPPNAAVFSADYLRIEDMVRAGVWMNLAAVVLISAFVLLWQPVAMG